MLCIVVTRGNSLSYPSWRFGEHDFPIMHQRGCETHTHKFLSNMIQGWSWMAVKTDQLYIHMSVTQPHDLIHALAGWGLTPGTAGGGSPGDSWGRFGWIYLSIHLWNMNASIFPETKPVLCYLPNLLDQWKIKNRYGGFLKIYPFLWFPPYKPTILGYPLCMESPHIAYFHWSPWEISSHGHCRRVLGAWAMCNLGQTCCSPLMHVCKHSYVWIVRGVLFEVRSVWRHWWQCSLWYADVSPIDWCRPLSI